MERLPRFAATCVLVAGALALAPGCASGPDAKTTVESMGAFGLEVAKVKDSIDSTIKALETVVASQPTEIDANVGTYSKAVAALEGQANVVKRRADEMKAEGDTFFKEWEAPEHVSAERRDQLNASYAKIKAEMSAAKEQFTPFLASSKDIASYLRVDPSTKGIQSIAALVKKAQDDGTKVKASIDAVLVQLNSVQGMMSTK